MTRRALILSGPTHEYIDPVRFIGNASSGKMGQALTSEALKRGYAVTLISGPVPPEHLPPFPTPGHGHLDLIRIVSAEEMLHAAQPVFGAADLILFAAAVADFKPAVCAPQKLSKTRERMTLDLVPNPDLAATLCADKSPRQMAIGFALQTHDGIRLATEKRIRKHLDAIVLNSPSSLGADDGEFTWIDTRGPVAWGVLDKPACAARIFDQVAFPVP